MIAQLEGKVSNFNLKWAIISVQGIGYKVHMPTGDLAGLEGKEPAIKAYIHTSVREDAIDLYGFLDIDSLQLFELLIGISGIGPKLGLAIISGMSPDVFKMCIHQGDVKKLTRIPGVGKKGAERMVLELADKLGKLDAPLFNFQENKAEKTLADVRSAIVNLGYKDAQIDSAMDRIREKAIGGASLQSLLTDALGALA